MTARNILCFMQSKEAWKHTLSPSRRLMPSSSMKAEVWMVVSCLSSSFWPSGERRDQATTKPTELLELLSKLHFRKTVLPITSETITGTDGVGGCVAGRRSKQTQLNVLELLELCNINSCYHERFRKAHCLNYKKHC